MSRKKSTVRRTPWLRTYTDLSGHRKTILLSDLLEIEPVLAVGHLVTLWHNVLVHKEDGDLSSCVPRHIARWSDWMGDPSVFVDALVESGFLDRDENNLRVHDWVDYVGQLLKNRNRVKTYRKGGTDNNVCTRTVRVQYALGTQPKRKRKSKSTEKEEEEYRSTPSVYCGQRNADTHGSKTPKRNIITKEGQAFIDFYARTVGIDKVGCSPPLFMSAYRDRKRVKTPGELQRLVIAWSKSKRWIDNNGRYCAGITTFLTKNDYLEMPPEQTGHGSLGKQEYTTDFDA